MNQTSPQTQADAQLHTINQALPKSLKRWLITLTVLLLINMVIVGFMTAIINYNLHQLYQSNEDIFDRIELEYKLARADARLKELETAQDEYNKTHSSP